MKVRYWVRVCENGDVESSANETKACELCGSEKWEVVPYEVDEDEAESA